MTHRHVALAIVLLGSTISMSVQAQPAPGSDFGNPWMANLVELKAPPPTPWWPPAPAWYAIAVAVVLAFGWLIGRSVSRWRADAYRRAALRELEAIRRDRNLSALSELIRRTALAAYPRTRIAHLIGDDWLRFLDESAGMTEFQHSVGAEMATLSYAPTPSETTMTEALLDATDQWIRRHRRILAIEGCGE